MTPPPKVRSIEIEIKKIDPLTERFTILPNCLHRGEEDPALGLDFRGYTGRARCLLAALLTMSTGFRCDRERIDAILPELGRAAMNTVLQELRDKGNLRTERTNRPVGGTFLWQWHISLHPMTANETAGQTMCRFSGDGEPGAEPGNEPGNETAGQTMGGLPIDGPTIDGQSNQPLRKKKYQEDLKPPPPAIVHVPAPRPARPDGGGGDLLDPDPQPPRRPDPPDSPAPVPSGPAWTEAGRDVLARVQDASDVGRRRLRGTPAAVLAAAIGRRLAAGWSEDDAVIALTGSFARADSVAATMTWRVEHLLAGPPPEATGNGPRTSPAAALPPWCGACDRTDYRWREDGEGRPYRCPECHPAELARAPVRSSA